MPIPHSGQTQCYNSENEIECSDHYHPFYGQSGHFVINPRSFTKLDFNANELPDDAEQWQMVRDNITGLVWEVKHSKDKTVDYNNPNDYDNTYTWYSSLSINSDNYTETFNKGNNTKDFIDKMNRNQYGGFNDWRLPSIKELASLSNLGKKYPAMDIEFFNTNISEVYWSSTSYADHENNAWCIQLNNGDCCYKRTSNQNYVRAVRGNQKRPFDHQVFNDDKTFTDTQTGLLWQLEIPEDKKNWKNALAYCVSLSINDYSDWRLPDRNELMSIVDFTKQSSEPDIYWSSTSYQNIPYYAWALNLNNGSDDFIDKTTENSVCCVRGGQIQQVDHLYILYPNQSSILITGKMTYISWQSSDINGNISIYLSRHGGKPDTFETLINDTENDGLYEWAVTGLPSANCVLKIESLSSKEKFTQQGLFTIKHSDIHIHSNLHTVFSITGPKNYTGTGNAMTIDNAYPGEYTVSYAPIDYYQTPAKESKVLTWWGNISFSGIYNETPLPPSPEHLFIEQNTEKGIQLKWIPDDKLTCYTIYKSQSEQGLFYPIHSKPVDYHDTIMHGFWDTRIQPNSTYFYKIKSISQSGFESSEFSNTVSATVSDNKKNFDIIFKSKKHQIVSSGSKIDYQMFLDKNQVFQGYLDIWCTDLPKHIKYEISVDHEPGADKVENIQLLPAVLELSLFTDSATDPGNYQFILQCLNVDNKNGNQQKSYSLNLTVVPRTGGIFVDFDPERTYKNEEVSVFGYIYPPKENQSIFLEAWHGNEKYLSKRLKTQLSGWFENSQWVKSFLPGIYDIKATWSGIVSLPLISEKKGLVIEKIHPEIILVSLENQVPTIDKEFKIKGQIDPIYESELIQLVVLDPDNTQVNMFDMYTNKEGQFYLSHQFFEEKGKYTFKAYFMGNETSIGCESNKYEVMVGHTGCAIIVGGGNANPHNTKWKVTKKLVTDAYIDFKNMGFKDDMIYLMINSKMIDINNDEIADNIVDQISPTAASLTDTISNYMTTYLNEDQTLYLYMMGHGTDNAMFKVNGEDQYISSKQINAALDKLQEKTQCSVVIIIECCYSGEFIKELSHPKRVIITSAGNEQYKTDATGRISLSRYLFPRLCNGDSLKQAFNFAQYKLSGANYPSPLLDDNGDRQANNDDGKNAASIYLPKELIWFESDISQVNLYPILDGKNTLDVSLTIESKPENITKVWAQVIAPDDMITSSDGIIQFKETRLNHEQGTLYSGNVTGFSHDGTYIVIFYAQNKLNQVSESKQFIVRAINIGRKKDFNQDGLINIEDVIIVMKSLSGMKKIENVVLSDVVHLMQSLAGNQL